MRSFSATVTSPARASNSTGTIEPGGSAARDTRRSSVPTSARTSRAWGGGTPGPSLTTHTTLSPSRESRGAGEAGERAAGTASATAGCPGSAHDHSCVPSRAVRVSSKRPDVARETRASAAEYGSTSRAAIRSTTAAHSSGSTTSRVR